MFALIHTLASPDISVGIVDVTELNQIANQARATNLASLRAIGALHKPPDVVLIDGAVAVDTGAVPSVAVTKLWHGTTSLSIAAASIVASVTHHRIMVEYADLYPAYGFHRHNGHVSPAHLAALTEYGPSPIHHTHNRKVQAALAAHVG